MKKVIFISLLFLSFNVKAQNEFYSIVSYKIDSTFISVKFRELDSLELSNLFVTENFTKNAIYFESEYFIESELDVAIQETYQIYLIYKSLINFNFYDVWIDVKHEKKKTKYQIQFVVYNTTKTSKYLKRDKESN